jgi:hypothetical protein
MQSTCSDAVQRQYMLLKRYQGFEQALMSKNLCMHVLGPDGMLSGRNSYTSLAECPYSSLRWLVLSTPDYS